MNRTKQRSDGDLETVSVVLYTACLLRVTKVTEAVKSNVSLI